MFKQLQNTVVVYVYIFTLTLKHKFGMREFNVTAYLVDIFCQIYQYCLHSAIVCFVIAICLRHNTGVLQWFISISTLKQKFWYV